MPAIDRFHLEGGILWLERIGEWTEEDAKDLEAFAALKARQIRRWCAEKKAAASDAEAKIAAQDKRIGELQAELGVLKLDFQPEQ